MINRPIVRPIVREITRGLDGSVLPIFDLSLQDSLVPKHARGSFTSTFTRATTAIVPDFNGVLHLVKSAEARFKGTRWVTNPIIKSEDMTDGAYSTNANAVIDSATQVIYDGTSNGEVLQSVAITDDGGGTGSRSFVYTAKVALVSGTLSGVEIAMSGSAVAFVSNNITSQITSIPQRFRVAGSTDAAGTTVEARIRSDGACTLSITEWQLEETTGNDDTTLPGDYVSTGVLSAPFHGANIDGVQNFVRKNGNSVTNNIVTEGVGALIAASDEFADADGNFGYMLELAALNFFLQSESLSTAPNALTNAVVALNSGTAPDAKNTLNKITDDNSSGTGNVFVLQAVVVTTDVDTTHSFYLKADQLTWGALGTSGFDATGNGTTWFNLSAGTVGTQSGNHSNATIEALPNSIFRCSITFKSTTDLAGLAILFVADSDANVVVDLDGTSSIFAWGGQVETGSFPTSYIPTTTVSVTRDADVLTYDDVGNILDAAGTAFAEASTDWATAPGTQFIIARDSNGRIITAAVSAPTTISIDDGPNTSISPTGTNYQNSPQKCATKWGAALTAYSPGTLLPDLTPASYDGTIGSSDIGIGNSGGGSSGFSGTIRNVKIFGTEFTDAQVASL